MDKAATPASANAAQIKADSERYLKRKAGFNRCLTIYGRKPVLEALQQPGVRCERLHLAQSNKSALILDQICALARQSNADIREHDRASLSRISRNAREDQGVAADISLQSYRELDDDLLASIPATGKTFIAADGLTNPQNLGMLIRSAAAGRCDGIIIPRKRGCDLSPLVIKASAGAVFRAPILRCERLEDSLTRLRAQNWRVAILDAAGDASVFAPLDSRSRVFVLGSETDGISKEVSALADERLQVPMMNGIESLNVAVTAALVAYRNDIGRPDPDA